MLKEPRCRRYIDDILFVTNIDVKCDLLFSRDVALAYWGAVHFSYLHITLDLSEIQAQVLTTNSNKRATLPGTPKRCDLKLNVKFLYLLMTWFHHP